MPKKTIHVRVQDSHPMGLPCTGCQQKIYEDEPFTEEIMPSEMRKSYCGCCRPIHNLGRIGKRRSKEIVVRM